MNTRPTIFLLFFLFSLFVSAQTAKPAKETKFREAGMYAHAKLSHKIITAVNNTYGYDIYSDGKLIIHQPTVPGMPGNGGFKTKDGAEKVAQLVTTKIGKGEMPPTVTVEEMKKIKALQ